MSMNGGDECLLSARIVNRQALGKPDDKVGRRMAQFQRMLRSE
jgi:hypothetical protein